MIASNINDFINIVMEGEVRELNSEVGQAITNELLKIKLEENPNLTKEEWEKTKQEFMVFIFAMLIKNDKALMKELAGHVWNELKE